MSPVTTAREPNPMRVKNIFICSRVVFWASSRMMNASFRVRPRMKANGTTSMTPRSDSRVNRSGPSISYRASYSGRRYGSTLAAMSPGRNPRRSPASTAGRVSTMRCTARVRSATTAIATARYVLPVPAGPMAKVRSWVRIAWT